VADQAGPAAATEQLVPAAPEGPATPDDGAPGGGGWSRLGLACLALVLVYVGLSFLNHPGGYLGSDTGGKVATLRSMEASHRLDADVGYWAEEWDPDGRLHPLVYTAHLAGKWVNATTVPILYAAYPLYRLGGYRLALLLPMLGSILAALAARALARRIGGPGHSGDLAFWVVGLLSPLTIYALDFWEHSLGVALLLWAVVILLDLADRDSADGRAAKAWVGWRSAVAAGVLIGAAATMRTEALVYGMVAVIVAGWAVVIRGRRVLPAVVLGAAVVAGAVLPLVANAALERATIGTSIRSERTASAARSGGSEASDRVRQGLLTTVSLRSSDENRALVEGLAVLGLVVAAAAALARPQTRRVGGVAAVGVAALYGLRLASGTDFVPGLFAAAPLATIGLALGWHDRNRWSRPVLAIGVLAIPLVWAFQFLGGMTAQWGGRYLLVSGALLTVVGTVALATRLPRAAQVGALALAAAVTVFGLTWLSVRSHDMARATATLNNRPEPVLVSRIEHLARDGGGSYGDHRWLTVVEAGELRAAADVVGQAGFDSFALVDLASSPDAPTAIAAFTKTTVATVRLFSDVDLRVTTYVAAPPANVSSTDRPA